MSRGRARPQLLRVEQTRSELVFGMPAPRRISSVHGHDLEGEQWVDLTHSAHPWAMTVICAFETFERRLELTFSGPSRPRSWTPQLGGKRRYRSCLMKGGVASKQPFLCDTGTQTTAPR